MLVVWHQGWRCQSVSFSIALPLLVQTEISQQQLDGCHEIWWTDSLGYNVIIMTLVIPLLFI